MVCGIGVWLLFTFSALGEQFPAQLAGVLAATLGMLVGSLTPQTIENSRGSHHRLSTEA